MQRSPRSFKIRLVTKKKWATTTASATESAERSNRWPYPATASIQVERSDGKPSQHDTRNKTLTEPKSPIKCQKAHNRSVRTTLEIRPVSCKSLAPHGTCKVPDQRRVHPKSTGGHHLRVVSLANKLLRVGLIKQTAATSTTFQLAELCGCSVAAE